MSRWLLSCWMTPARRRWWSRTVATALRSLRVRGRFRFWELGRGMGEGEKPMLKPSDRDYLNQVHVRVAQPPAPNGNGRWTTFVAHDDAQRVVDSLTTVIAESRERVWREAWLMGWEAGNVSQ